MLTGAVDAVLVIPDWVVAGPVVAGERLISVDECDIVELEAWEVICEELFNVLVTIALRVVV